MLRSLASLLSSHGILLIANGLFATIVSLKTKTSNFPDALIGLVLAGYFAGLLLSSLYSAKVVANIGHIRAFALFASLASTVALGHLLWIDPFFWMFLRMVMGFSMGGMIVVTEGWLNERADNKNRGKILSTYMIITYACIGLSQLLITIASPDGFELFVIVSILFSFALIPILMTRSATPAPASSARPNIRQLYRTSPVGMIGSITVGITNAIFYSFSPIYAYEMGLSVNETALFIGISFASGMLLQIPLGRLSDRIDRRWVIALATSLAVGACYLLFLASHMSFISLLIVGACYGSVAFSINPLCVAHVNDLSPANERTQTASGLLMFYGIGALCGPVCVGFILPLGAEYIFVFSGSILTIFALYTLMRLLVKPRTLQHKARFKPYSLQSPTRTLAMKMRGIKKRRKAIADNKNTEKQTRTDSN